MANMTINRNIVAVYIWKIKSNGVPIVNICEVNRCELDLNVQMT